jgi:prepilin-type N-terminal cleavage/methylation domain-containing protein
MAAPLQAQDWEVMSPRRSRQAGFTITEMMVVLVIIGLLAAVATPSLTRDSTARKGRDFANVVAQGLQRAHLDAMNLRASHIVQLCTDSMALFNLAFSASVPIRSVTAPPGVAIWDATTSLTDPAPTQRGLGDTGSSSCKVIYFNPTGNAGVSTSAADLASWNIYVRNENLVNPNHPDGGFLITVTGLTAFVSTRNFTFSQ